MTLLPFSLLVEEDGWLELREPLKEESTPWVSVVMAGRGCHYCRCYIRSSSQHASDLGVNFLLRRLVARPL